MKKIYSLVFVAVFAFIASCTDESLDPLNFNKVSKGSLLALRGQFLQNIYVAGKPGAEFVPLIANGTEKFVFDAEFLSDDPAKLESIDIYVEKKPSLNRVLLKNVKASEFTTGANGRPVVKVTLGLSEILTKLGIPATYPLAPTSVNTLVTTYKFGINIITDVNMTDGTKVLADDLVAAGLYQSNQFYPAQKLNYVVINYCAYDFATWSGSFTANEVYSAGSYGPYTITFATAPGFPNRLVMNNFWDYGLSAYIEFTPSTNPKDQIVTFPKQTVDGLELTGTGTYDECTKTFKIQTKYGTDEWRYEFTQD